MVCTQERNMRTQVFEKTKMCQDLKDPQMPSVSVDISCPRQVPHPGCLCQRRQLSIRAFPVGPSLSDTQKWQRHDETSCGTVSYDGDTEIKSLRSELNNLPDLALALSTHSCTVVSKKLRADFDDVNFSAPIKFQLSWFNPLAMLERVAASLPHQGVH